MQEVPVERSLETMLAKKALFPTNLSRDQTRFSFVSNSKVDYKSDRVTSYSFDGWIYSRCFCSFAGISGMCKHWEEFLSPPPGILCAANGEKVSKSNLDEERCGQFLYWTPFSRSLSFVILLEKEERLLQFVREHLLPRQGQIIWVRHGRSTTSGRGRIPTKVRSRDRQQILTLSFKKTLLARSIWITLIHSLHLIRKPE